MRDVPVTWKIRLCSDTELDAGRMAEIVRSLRAQGYDTLSTQVGPNATVFTFVGEAVLGRPTRGTPSSCHLRVVRIIRGLTTDDPTLRIDTTWTPVPQEGPTLTDPPQVLRVAPSGTQPTEAFVVMISTEGENGEEHRWAAHVAPTRDEAITVIAAMKTRLDQIHMEIAVRFGDGAAAQIKLGMELPLSVQGEQITEWLAPFGSRDALLLTGEHVGFAVIQCSNGEWSGDRTKPYSQYKLHPARSE